MLSPWLLIHELYIVFIVLCSPWAMLVFVRQCLLVLCFKQLTYNMTDLLFIEYCVLCCVSKNKNKNKKMSGFSEWTIGNNKSQKI